MRKEILQELHVAHQGRERAMARARQCVYWPMMENDIKNTITSCKECELYKPSQQSEPLMQDTIGTRPGEAIAMDLFYQGGKDYLVITDKYTGWLDVYDMNRSTDTERVLNSLLKWSSIMGVPIRLTSDNGPQFKSLEFANFCKKWMIKHDPSSPYHPISNGHAEAAVKTAKSLIKKICPGRLIERSPEFLHALLEYRNTPRKDGVSPAERLFGRLIRGKLLPLHPVASNENCHKKITKADEKRLTLREKAKSYYDRNKKPLKPFEIGEMVRVQHPQSKEWGMCAEIMGMRERGRSYLLKPENGERLFVRNRKYIKKSF
jgi:transposase InsO family protein